MVCAKEKCKRLSFEWTSTFHLAEMIPVIEVVRTEIKNLNSLCMVYTAVNSELGRQYEILRAGGTVLNETRTVDHYGNTIAIEKEIEMDYRFMPEPNLPPD
ncbi:GatB/GatE catalytic domain family protein [Brugia pahangi]